MKFFVSREIHERSGTEGAGQPGRCPGLAWAAPLALPGHVGIWAS